jgi:integrase
VSNPQDNSASAAHAVSASVGLDDRWLLDELLADAKQMAAQRLAPSTLDAYRKDWGHFERWCLLHGVSSLPASGEDTASYLAALYQRDGCAKSTVMRRAAAIGHHHRNANQPSPLEHELVRELLPAIRRRRERPVSEARALSTTELLSMLQVLGTDAKGLRNRAVLLAGFFGGLRRSEIVAIDVADLSPSPAGVTVRIGFSKTDQNGHGRSIALPRQTNDDRCPVRAIDRWRTEAEITEGPLFRRVRRGGVIGDQAMTDQSVNLIVKDAAGAAGVHVEGLSAHSLRSGFVTAAAHAGQTERQIARQTGHRSDVLRRYIQTHTAFADNAVMAVEL